MAKVSIIGATNEWVSLVNFGNENARIEGWKVGDSSVSGVLIPPGAVSRLDQVKDAWKGVTIVDEQGNNVYNLPQTNSSHQAPVIYGLDDRLAVEETDVDDIAHAGVGILCVVAKIVTVANFSDKQITLDGWILNGYELEGFLDPGEAERFEIDPVDTERGTFIELIDRNEELVDAILFPPSSNNNPIIFDLDHRIAARELLAVAEKMDAEEPVAAREDISSEEEESVESEPTNEDDDFHSLPKDEFDSAVGVDKVVVDRIIRDDSFKHSIDDDEVLSNASLTRQGTAKMGSLNYSNADFNKNPIREQAESADHSFDENAPKLEQTTENNLKSEEDTATSEISSNIPPSPKFGGDAASWIRETPKAAESSVKPERKSNYSQSVAVFNDSWIKSSNATPVPEERSVSENTFANLKESNPVLKDTWIATTAAIPVEEESNENEEILKNEKIEPRKVQDSWIESTAATHVLEESIQKEEKSGSVEEGSRTFEKTFTDNKSETKRLEDSWIKSTSATPVLEERVASDEKPVAGEGESDINHESFENEKIESKGVADSWIRSTSATPVTEENVLKEEENYPEFLKSERTASYQASLDNAPETHGLIESSPSIERSIESASESDGHDSEEEEEIFLDALPPGNEGVISETEAEDRDSARGVDGYPEESIEVEASDDAFEGDTTETEIQRSSSNRDSEPENETNIKPGSVLDRIAMWNQ